MRTIKPTGVAFLVPLFAPTPAPARAADGPGRACPTAETVLPAAPMTALGDTLGVDDIAMIAAPSGSPTP